MATAVLQAQLEELQKMAPGLSPIVVPRGFDVQTLSALAQEDGGKAGVEQLRKVLASWAQRTNTCGICDSAGQAAVGRDEGAEEEVDMLDELRFTTLWQPDFKAKILSVARGMFACGRCRFCLDAGSWARLGALALQPVDPGMEDEATAAPLAEELVAHAVFANGGMRGAGGRAHEGDAGLWVQELVARAYSLRVVASNVVGWKLAGPSGAPLPHPAKGRAAALAEELLRSSGAGTGAKAGKTPTKKKSKKGGTETPQGGKTPITKTPQGRKTPGGRTPEGKTPGSIGSKRKGGGTGEGPPGTGPKKRKSRGGR